MRTFSKIYVALVLLSGCTGMSLNKSSLFFNETVYKKDSVTVRPSKLILNNNGTIYIIENPKGFFIRDNIHKLNDSISGYKLVITRDTLPPPSFYPFKIIKHDATISYLPVGLNYSKQRFSLNPSDTIPYLNLSMLSVNDSAYFMPLGRTYFAFDTTISILNKKVKAKVFIDDFFNAWADDDGFHRVSYEYIDTKTYLPLCTQTYIIEHNKHFLISELRLDSIGRLPQIMPNY